MEQMKSEKFGYRYKRWKVGKYRKDGGDLVIKPDTRNTSKSRYSGVRKSKSEEVEKVKNISRGVVRMNQILTIEGRDGDLAYYLPPRTARPTRFMRLTLRPKPLPGLLGPSKSPSAGAVGAGGSSFPLAST